MGSIMHSLFRAVLYLQTSAQAYKCFIFKLKFIRTGAFEMQKLVRRSILSGLFVIAMATLTTPAVTQNVESFYKDKTISLVIGTEPGGSYDLYGRTIAAHLSKYVPGHPAISVEYMPGAGGAVAGNYIYGVGPQDGTKLLLAHALPMIEKLQGGSNIRFESGKFNWIGAYDAFSIVVAMWHTAPAASLLQLRTADVAIGTLNKNHSTYQAAALLKDVLGANFKIIAGYRSGNELNIAMERGEVHGVLLTWENIIGTRKQWVDEKKIIVPVQFTLERMAQLKDVPTLIELASPSKKDVVEFYSAGTPMSRTMAVGPGVPVDRVAVLRNAFDELMIDKDFLAECAQRRLSIEPRNAATISALIKTILSASPELIARVKTVFAVEP
jgi:tripartite-type tricarboxylate transporter receptor subunit TctC